MRKIVSQGGPMPAHHQTNILPFTLLAGAALFAAGCEAAARVPAEAAQALAGVADPTTLTAERRAELARKVIGTSAAIRPGDVLVIDGGAHTLPLMEDLAIEANRAGAFSTLWVTSDRILRSYYRDVAEQHLEREPGYLKQWLEPITAYIVLSGAKDPEAVFSDIPEGRFAKARKASQTITEMINRTRIRVVSIGYPSTERAESYGLAPEAYATMHWAGVGADYQRIAAVGGAIRDRLRSAKEVRITSSAGTDLRFAIGARPVFLDAGIVTAEAARDTLFLHRFAALPGGSVFVAPLETSATGVVVVPQDHCRLQPLVNARYEFTRGTLANFTAAEGEPCVRETLAAYTAPVDRLGALTIGLNPELQVSPENGRYRPEAAAGLVTLGVGENRLLGGANSVSGEGGFSITLVGATVTIDGTVVVQDGRLAPAVAQTATAVARPSTR
jgi:aminopeptidase